MPSLAQEEEKKGDAQSLEEEKKETLANGGEEENIEVCFKAGQVAPLLDRMGRIMIDFAPHLNQITKNH